LTQHNVVKKEADALKGHVPVEKLALISDRNVQLMIKEKNTPSKILDVIHGATYEVPEGLKIVDTIYGQLCLTDCEWCAVVKVQRDAK